MTRDELNQRLSLRIDWFKENPGPFVGPPCEGLEIGDEVHLEGRYLGWTQREIQNTPHVWIDMVEADADVRSYMVEYWLAVWSGTRNEALERRIKQVAAVAEAKIKREADQAKYEKQYLKRYGPPAAYQFKTFAAFKAETPKQEAALEAASKFPYVAADDWENRTHTNFVLTGPVGVGKTLLASAMFVDRWENDCSPEFITSTALMRKFREKGAKESTLLARYGDGLRDSNDGVDGGCKALIVDDLGIEADRYAAEVFSEILDRRTGADLLSIFTTNCTAAELRAWLGERGYSRLMYRCRWYVLDGDDRRLR